MVDYSFSVTVRGFSEESESCYLLAWRHLHPLNVCLVVCFQILVVRTPALMGVWGTATIFFSLKPGIPKVGSGITSKFLGY